MSPADFNRALDRFAQKTLARATEHTVRQSGERLLERIRENTPVRTGAARDAWTMRIEGSGFSARVVISNPRPPETAVTVPCASPVGTAFSFAAFSASITRSGVRVVAMSTSSIGRPTRALRTLPPTNRAQSTSPSASASSAACVSAADGQIVEPGRLAVGVGVACVVPVRSAVDDAGVPVGVDHLALGRGGGVAAPPGRGVALHRAAHPPLLAAAPMILQRWGWAAPGPRPVHGAE